METTTTGRLSPIARSELRASHAGETGAVWIYRGIMTVNWIFQDRQIAEFASHHLQTEKQHLEGFEEIIHHYRGSLLLIVWAVAGFLTGAIPAILGKNFVYYTIYSVESFVDKHYAEQAKILSTETHPVLLDFLPKMAEFHADEKDHRDQALQAMTRPPTLFMKLWGRLVGIGSSVAVKFARIM